MSVDYPTRTSQEGMITVILVVLLLLVVGTALMVVLRISGSGATDATAQEDSMRHYCWRRAGWNGPANALPTAPHAPAPP